MPASDAEQNPTPRHGHASEAGAKFPPSWKTVVAGLANPDQRLIFARLITETAPDHAFSGIPAKKQEKITQALLRAGLVRLQDDELVANATIFSDLLKASAEKPKTGLERFLDGTRIIAYPKSPVEREELLRWVVDRAVAPTETLDEKALNERLRAFSEDVAALRRYLVDFELLHRAEDGSQYRR